MRRRIRGLSALLLCVVPLLSCREPFQPPYVIGFAESHSWIDTGIKAVVSDDGTGFAMRLASSGGAGSTFEPEVVRVRLTPAPASCIDLLARSLLASRYVEREEVRDLLIEPE